MVTITVISEADFGPWQAYVDSNVASRAMHHVGWYGVLRDAFSVGRYFLMARDSEGRVRGILPAYFSSGVLMGRHVASLDDGILADDSDTARALLEKAISIRDHLRGRYLLLRNPDSNAPPVSATLERPIVRRIVDVNRSPEDFFKSLSGYVRRDIRRAEKRGYKIVTDRDLANIDRAFYDEYARHMHHLGTPVMDRRMMTALREHLGSDRLRLYLALHGDEIIGGLLCVLANAGWSALYGIIRQDLSLDYANHLLYWQAIADACAGEPREFDLGRNAPGSGAHKFKERWTGEDRPAAHFYFAALNSTMPNFADVYGGQTPQQRLWMKLPRGVANVLGPVLRRQLPFG